MTLLEDRAPASAPPATQTRPAAPAAGGGAFRADIEGLRGLALALVLAFHAAVPGFAAGFVGLDLFFVISGYLITGQLAAEMARRGRIDLRAFYARRARRIFPMAGVVGIATAVAGYLVLPQLEVYRLSHDLVASMAYYANWHFIAEGNDYLALTHGESAAQHFWSLSVEEQFYLAWPLLLVLGAVLAGRRGRARRREPGAGAAPVLAVVTIVSLGLSVWLSSTDPGAAYMGTHTRAWEFGVGGLLALVVPAAATGLRRRAVADLCGLAAVVLLVVGLVSFSRATAYPGVAAVVPVLACCLLILAGPTSASGMLLRLPPVRAVGRWSYSIYLWHWPLLVLTEAALGSLTWQQKAALMGVSVLLGAVSFRLVERAIAASGTLRQNLRAAGSLGLTALVAGLSAALVMGTTVVNAIGTPSSTADQATFEQVFGATTSRTSGAVAPSPLYAEGDLPTPPDCIIDDGSTPTRDCVFGAPGGRRVVLVGDSHAHQWQSALQIMADERGWELTVTAKAGCPITDIAPRPGDDSRLSDPSCPRWREQTFDRIADLRPDMIVFTSLGDYIPERDQLEAAWKRTVSRLRDTGAELVYLRDTPRADFDVPTCVSGSLDDWSACSFPAPDRFEPIIADAARGALEDVHIIDLNGFLCDGDTCPAVRNGTLMYRDDAHLTDTVVRLLTPAMRQAFDREGLR